MIYLLKTPGIQGFNTIWPQQTFQCYFPLAQSQVTSALGLCRRSHALHEMLSRFHHTPSNPQPAHLTCSDQMLTFLQFSHVSLGTPWQKQTEKSVGILPLRWTSNSLHWKVFFSNVNYYLQVFHFSYSTISSLKVKKNNNWLIFIYLQHLAKSCLFVKQVNKWMNMGKRKTNSPITTLSFIRELAPKDHSYR